MFSIEPLFSSYLTHYKGIIIFSAKNVENLVEISEFLKLKLITAVFLPLCITFVLQNKL
jgi:hypothetical protein